MTKKVPGQTRAARFKVPNNERVILYVDSEAFAGTLSVLSTTGGVVRLVKRHPPGTFAEIVMNTISGKVTTPIELLAARHEGTQAFQFVHLGAANRKKLEAALENMRKQGLSDAKTSPLHGVMRLARRLLPRDSKR